MDKSVKLASLIICSPMLLVFFWWFSDLSYYFEISIFIWSLFWFFALNIILYLWDWLFAAYLVLMIPTNIYYILLLVSTFFTGEENGPFMFVLFAFIIYVVFEKDYDEKIQKVFFDFCNFLEEKFTFLEIDKKGFYFDKFIDWIAKWNGSAKNDEDDIF